MSPAPVRTRSGPTDQFPHAWGYWAGAMFILAGIVAATVMVVTGVTGFVSDVQDFRREARNGSLETALARGAEIFIYNEDGLDAGPFDVKVTRVSDDVEVATSVVQNGTTYDVDGRTGTARAAFNVPTSDIYRVEVDASVGSIASFAVGPDVGNDRTSSVLRGVALGSVLALLGFLAIVWTAVLHARWRLRDAVLDQVASARSVVSNTLGRTRAAEGPADAATGTVRRTASWAQQRSDAARARIEAAAASSDGTNPLWRDSLADEARSRLDQVDEALASVEPAVADTLAGSEVPSELADRIDEALGRVQSRIETGDSLTDIVRDERVVAEDAARELAGQARAAQQDAVQRLEGVEQALRDEATGQLDALRGDLTEVSTTALDDIAGQTSDARDNLATGLIATTAAAAGATASAVTNRGRDVLGTESTTGPTPMSSLPAPPPVSMLAVATPAPTPVPASTPDSTTTTSPASAAPDVEPATGSNEAARTQATSSMPPVRLDTFSALRPPPGQASAPVVAPLAGAWAIEPEADEPEPEVDDLATDPVDPEVAQPRGFSLAPPPKYGSL